MPGEKHVAGGMRSEDVRIWKIEGEGGGEGLKGEVEDGEWEREESVERVSRRWQKSKETGKCHVCVVMGRIVDGIKAVISSTEKIDGIHSPGPRQPAQRQGRRRQKQLRTALFCACLRERSPIYSSSRYSSSFSPHSRPFAFSSRPHLEPSDSFFLYITPPPPSPPPSCRSPPMPSALAALPVELLDAVLAPLAYNHTSLAAAALSCGALNPSATRLLYRHLSLSAYARNLNLIHLLAARPDLAILVRTLSVHLDDTEPPAQPTYSGLQHALVLMTNLQSLALYVDASTSWILTPAQGENGQKSSEFPNPGSAFYPRLEHLTCNFPLDPHLASFLGQVPSLISLTLSSVLSDDDAEPQPDHAHPDEPAPPRATSAVEHVRIPPSHIPLLEAYTGPAHLLPTLVSRPLKAVHLFGDLTLDLLPTDSPSTSPVDEAVAHLRGLNLDATFDRTLSTDSLPTASEEMQVMSAMTSAPPAQLLEILAVAFPNLVCLRLMTTRALWDLPDLVSNCALPASYRPGS